MMRFTRGIDNVIRETFTAAVVMSPAAELQRVRRIVVGRLGQKLAEFGQQVFLVLEEPGYLSIYLKIV